MQSHHHGAPAIAPIVENLESIAANKALRPRSAYQFFVEEKLKLGKENKPDGCKSFKDAGALWKTLTAKQKEPYVKMNKDSVAAAEAVKKEWGKTFDKHWADIEKHLEAEDKSRAEKAKNRAAQQKEQAAQAKKQKTERKKHLIADKKRRAAARTGRTIPRARSAHTSSAVRCAELSRGLDTSLWEVRESTSRPGFFYYLNKKTRETTAERPKSSRSGAPLGSAPSRQRTR